MPVDRSDVELDKEARIWLKIKDNLNKLGEAPNEWDHPTWKHYCEAVLKWARVPALEILKRR